MELKELHWNTDKDHIEKILHHLNPKYLLGRLEAHNKNRNYEAMEKHPEKKYVVCIKYDGCTFTASKNTLEKECWRRVREGTMVAVKDMQLWRSPTRYCRFAAVRKNNMMMPAKRIKPMY